MNNNYAILELKKNKEKTIETLKQYGLSLVKTQELTWLNAIAYFGIYPTEENIGRFKDCVAIIVSGTKEAYKSYCTNPANDVGEYWSR